MEYLLYAQRYTTYSKHRKGPSNPSAEIHIPEPEKQIYSDVPNSVKNTVFAWALNFLTSSDVL